MLSDPSGATFCVWQASENKGAQLVNEPGTGNFSGLNTRDPAGARAFYGAVFGWEASSTDADGGDSEVWRLPGYGDFLEQLDPGMRRRMADLGAPEGFEDAVAWLLPMTSDQFPDDTPPHWSVTFAVDDADAIADRAAELGGKVLVPPLDAPWVRMTVLSDPRGRCSPRAGSRRPRSGSARGASGRCVVCRTVRRMAAQAPPPVRGWESRAMDPFASFLRDAEALLDDPHAIARRLSPLLAEDGWLGPEDRRPGAHGYRQHLLHVSPSRRLSVVALVWLPGQRTPIHDHVSWCVVGVYRGTERESRFRLVHVDGEPCLEPTGHFEAHAGHVEVLVPPAENIHAVVAAGPGPTISIHVYGADIERLGSSVHRRFDHFRRLAPAA